MNDQPVDRQSSLLAWCQEMARRHVFRVLALYVAIGWGFTEIIQGVVEQIGAPPAIATFTTIAFIVGFPVVLFLAWVFDVSKDGVRRAPTGRKGQLLVSLALAVAIAGSYGLYRYLPDKQNQKLTSNPTEQIVLAVLPFRNLSADTSKQFMGEAIAQDLLNSVAEIEGLKVKASFSSFSLQGEDATAFRQKLGVNRILEGTFRDQDNNLRLSARLIDTASGDVVWTRVLTDSVENIFQVIDQIGKDIAADLGLVHPRAASTTSRKVDPLVYQLYLQARIGMINPWLDTDATIQKIRQVLERAPNFPEALSFMGFLDTGRAWIMEDRQAPWLKTGEEYAQRALEADPDLAEAYAVLALNYALQYDWNASRRYADRAIEVAGPRPLNVVYTFSYNNLGHRQRTIDLLHRIYDQDPLNPGAINNLMTTYVQLGEHEKALQWEELAQEMGLRYQRHYLIQSYAHIGDVDTARQLAALWGEEHGFALELGEDILQAFLTGRSEAFENATDIKVAAGELPSGQAIWNYIASGAPADKVFALIDLTIEQGKFNQISLMSPFAVSYRQDRRFIEVFKRLGLLDYWLNVELPDFCEHERIVGLCV